MTPKIWLAIDIALCLINLGLSATNLWLWFKVGSVQALPLALFCGIAAAAAGWLGYLQAQRAGLL